MDEKDKEKVSFQNIKIPDIALGKVIPYGVERQIELEERAKKAERKASLYAILGIVATVVCTIIGWLLGKFC